MEQIVYSLLRVVELGRSKVPGFGGIQPGAQLGSPGASHQGVALCLGALPKTGSLRQPKTVYSAIGPLYNKGSRDPAGEKASFLWRKYAFLPQRA